MNRTVSQIRQQTAKVALPANGILQRKCAACGQHTIAGGECEGCSRKRLQRRTASQAEPTELPSIVHDVLRSPGQPLDANTRAFMEPRFGHDFSSVRVHTDAKAAESARVVNALAYTVGRDVVFGAGQYALGMRDGQRLLAHELTHVVQQRHGQSGGLQKQADDRETEVAAEEEAERTATRVTA